MSEKIDTNMVIAILRMIREKNGRINQGEMAAALNVSKPTIARAIKRARDHLKVDIVYVRTPEVDDPGWWEVRNYGILDPHLFEPKTP